MPTNDWRVSIKLDGYLFHSDREFSEEDARRIAVHMAKYLGIKDAKILKEERTRRLKSE